MRQRGRVAHCMAHVIREQGVHTHHYCPSTAARARAAGGKPLLVALPAANGYSQELEIEVRRIGVQQRVEVDEDKHTQREPDKHRVSTRSGP